MNLDPLYHEKITMMRHNLLFSQTVHAYVKGFIFGVAMLGGIFWLFLQCMPFLMESSFQSSKIDHQKIFMQIIKQPIVVSLSLGIDLYDTRGITGHFKQIIRKYPHIHSISLFNNENVIMKRYVSKNYLERGDDRTYKEPILHPHSQYILGFLEFSYAPTRDTPLLIESPFIMIGMFAICLWGIFLGQRLWRDDTPLIFAIQYSMKLLKHGHFSTIFWTHKKNLYGVLVRHLNFFIIRAHEAMKNLDNHLRKKTFLRNCDRNKDANVPLPANPSSLTQHIDDVMLKVVLEQYRIPLSLKRHFLDQVHFSWHSVFHGMVVMEGAMSAYCSMPFLSNDTGFSSSLLFFWSVIQLLLLWIFFRVWEKWGPYFHRSQKRQTPHLSLFCGGMNVGGYLFSTILCMMEKTPMMVGCFTVLRWGVLIYFGRQILSVLHTHFKRTRTVLLNKKFFYISCLSFFVMGVGLYMMLDLLERGDLLLFVFFMILLMSFIKIFFDHRALDQNKSVKNGAISCKIPKEP